MPLVARRQVARAANVALRQWSKLNRARCHDKLFQPRFDLESVERHDAKALGDVRCTHCKALLFLATRCARDDVGDWLAERALLAPLNASVDELNATLLKRFPGREGYTYSLYKKLRPLGYDFVHSVHNKVGVNKWVRVVQAKENVTTLIAEVTALLEKHGWAVESAEADEADWESDDGEENP